MCSLQSAGRLTVDGAADGVRLCEVGDAAEQLGAVALTVLFDGADLGHRGGGVGPEDCLAVLPAGGVAPCIAAAGGAHCRNRHTVTNLNTCVRNHVELR